MCDFNQNLCEFFFALIYIFNELILHFPLVKLISYFHDFIMFIIQSSIKLVSHLILHDCYFCVGFVSLYISLIIIIFNLLFYSFVLLFFCIVWFLGGSRDAQMVELFITFWPKFTPEKPAQSKPSPDQIIIRPNRNSKWTEVDWNIQTVGCFGWTIFGPNSTETDHCPPLSL
jgi:hypothetical protein